MKLTKTLIFVTICFFSFNNKNSTKQSLNYNLSSNITENIVIEKSRKIISKTGIGIINLGDSLDKFDSLFKNIKQTKIFEEGVVWPKHSTFLKQSEWIEVEAENGEIISLIRTNSKDYETSKGIRIGQTITEIKSKGERIDLVYDVAQNLKFKMIDSGVLFAIDSLSQNQYYTNGGNFPTNLNQNAKVLFFEIHR